MSNYEVYNAFGDECESLKCSPKRTFIGLTSCVVRLGVDGLDPTHIHPPRFPCLGSVFVVTRTCGEGRLQKKQEQIWTKHVSTKRVGSHRMRRFCACFCAHRSQLFITTLTVRRPTIYRGYSEEHTLTSMPCAVRHLAERARVNPCVRSFARLFILSKNRRGHAPACASSQAETILDSS